MVDSLELRKIEGEDEYEYIYRICSRKNEIGTWDDVADILNKELQYEYTESRYRRLYRSLEKTLQRELNKRADLQNDISRLKSAKYDAEIARNKSRTEKIEYNRWIREQARDEMIRDEIVSAINSLEKMPRPMRVSVSNVEYDKTGKTGVLCIADAHYGTEFSIKGINGEILNEYNPEIFESRMKALLSKTIEIVEKEGLSHIKIYSLGDELDGILRVSQLMQLRYGVIESAIKYSEFLCKWLSALTDFVDVDFYMVGGNHTELRLIKQPKGTFADENMVKIIQEFISIRMNDNEKFRLIKNDSGLIFDNIDGLNILGIHGEVKNMETAIKEFSNLYNCQINVLIGGHLHHYESATVGCNREVVRVPSIMGLDPYALSLRKGTNAGATFIVFERGQGKTIEYSIKLN